LGFAVPPSLVGAIHCFQTWDRSALKNFMAKIGEIVNALCPILQNARQYAKSNTLRTWDAIASMQFAISLPICLSAYRESIRETLAMVRNDYEFMTRWRVREAQQPRFMS
jgi:hypothetical protein